MRKIDYTLINHSQPSKSHTSSSSSSSSSSSYETHLHHVHHLHRAGLRAEEAVVEARRQVVAVRGHQGRGRRLLRCQLALRHDRLQLLLVPERARPARVGHHARTALPIHGAEAQERLVAVGREQERVEEVVRGRVVEGRQHVRGRVQLPTRRLREAVQAQVHPEPRGPGAEHGRHVREAIRLMHGREALPSGVVVVVVVVEGERKLGGARGMA
jgi:hypothetical protein